MKTHTAGITFDQINKEIRKKDTSIAKKRKSNIWENSRHSYKNENPFNTYKIIQSNHYWQLSGH